MIHWIKILATNVDDLNPVSKTVTERGLPPTGCLLICIHFKQWLMFILQACTHNARERGQC